jgi:hypothetical protein
MTWAGGATSRGTGVRWGRFWLTERCKNWGGSRCGLVADPASHFGDGGRLDVAVNGVIAQRRMPTGWEAWAGCEVVGEGLKEEWWGAADDSADAEVRVHERLSHEIQTVEGWLRTGGCGVGERLGIGNDVLEGKEGVREVSERVRNASSARFGHKANVGAIMGPGGAKIKPSDAVSCPGCALQGGVMYDDELAWGWMGCAAKSWGEPRRPCQAEREGLGCHLIAEMVKGQLSQGKQFGPAVRGKGNVD